MNRQKGKEEKGDTGGVRIYIYIHGSMTPLAILHTTPSRTSQEYQARIYSFYLYKHVYCTCAHLLYIDLKLHRTRACFLTYCAWGKLIEYLTSRICKCKFAYIGIFFKLFIFIFDAYYTYTRDQFDITLYAQ